MGPAANVPVAAPANAGRAFYAKRPDLDREAGSGPATIPHKSHH